MSSRNLVDRAPARRCSIPVGTQILFVFHARVILISLLFTYLIIIDISTGAIIGTPPRLDSVALT